MYSAVAELAGDQEEQSPVSSKQLESFLGLCDELQGKSLEELLEGGFDRIDWITIASRMNAQHAYAVYCPSTCRIHFLHLLVPDVSQAPFTVSEDAALGISLKRLGYFNWDGVAEDVSALQRRTSWQCFTHHRRPRSTVYRGSPWVALPYRPIGGARRLVKSKTEPIQVRQQLVQGQKTGAELTAARRRRLELLAQVRRDRRGCSTALLCFGKAGSRIRPVARIRRAITRTALKGT